MSSRTRRLATAADSGRSRCSTCRAASGSSGTASRRRSRATAVLLEKIPQIIADAANAAAHRGLSGQGVDDAIREHAGGDTIIVNGDIYVDARERPPAELVEAIKGELNTQKRILGLNKKPSSVLDN